MCTETESLAIELARIAKRIRTETGMAAWIEMDCKAFSPPAPVVLFVEHPYKHHGDEFFNLENAASYADAFIKRYGKAQN